MSHAHEAMRGGRRRNPRTRRGTAIWVALALLVLVLAATAWVGARAMLAKGELEKAVPLASAIQRQVVAGDGAGVASTYGRLAEHAHNAEQYTSDPVWRSFELIPALGPNLTAVRQLASVTDEVAQKAVQPLTKVAGTVELADFKLTDGAIDTKPLVAAQPGLAAANTALGHALKRANGIDTSSVVPAVEDATKKMRGALEEAADSVGAVDRAVRILPAMLGATGPRDYVVLFQNPAELRSTGGISGALALIHTDQGRVQLAQQSGSGDFPGFPAPVLPLSTDTRGLYGDITAEYIQNVNLTPDFPLSGTLAREMWRQKFGLEANGVLSIDPIALSYLLEATGPVTLETGDVLSSDNAVQLLLSDVYAKYEIPAQQDAFFAAAAGSVFAAISDGKADPKKLVEALARAGDERRVYVWSADKADQSVLAGTTLAGELPTSDAEATRFGVYLNDATGAKMGTYLDVKVGVGQSTCRNDKRPNYGVDVTLTNVLTPEKATSLPAYVSGEAHYGVPIGSVKTLVSVYGAPDMQNLGLTRDGTETGYHPATDSTYPVSQASVELAPGESTVLHYSWLGGAPSNGRLLAETTPVMRAHETSTITVDCPAPPAK